jgi:hypothetical protein
MTKKATFAFTMQASRYIKHLDTLLFAIAAYYIIYLFTKYSGIGISPDSIMYASTAHSISENGNLITFNGGPLVFFPVFYPAFLSFILAVFNADPVSSGPVINGVLFASVIFLCGWMVSRFRSPSIVYKWILLGIIVLSPALLEIYTYLWSETLFILTILLFAVAFRQYQQKQTTMVLLVAAGVAAICCITRYAGVTVIATGGLLILMNSQLALRKRLMHVLTFGAAGISLLVTNIIINRLSSGLATGTREPSVTSFGENLYYFGTVMCDWLGLTEQTHPYGWLLATSIIIAMITALLWQWLKGRLNSYESIIITYAVVYSLFILIIATFSRFERMNSRLLSPLFIPLAIGCTSWLPDVLQHIRKKARLWAAIPAVFIMGLFIYNYILIDLKRYDDEFDYGVPGYTDDDWNKSAFVVFLKQHKQIYKPGVPLYSNADEAVYFFGGMRAKLHVFFKQDVAKFYSKKHFYLVWFKALNPPELLGLKDIEKVKKLKLLYDLEDGAVYEYNE